jgi:hypothetical protein
MRRPRGPVPPVDVQRPADERTRRHRPSDGPDFVRSGRNDDGNDRPDSDDDGLEAGPVR